MNRRLFGVLFLLLIVLIVDAAELQDIGSPQDPYQEYSNDTTVRSSGLYHDLLSNPIAVVQIGLLGAVVHYICVKAYRLSSEGEYGFSAMFIIMSAIAYYTAYWSMQPRDMVSPLLVFLRDKFKATGQEVIFIVVDMVTIASASILGGLLFQHLWFDTFKSITRDILNHKTVKSVEKAIESKSGRKKRHVLNYVALVFGSIIVCIIGRTVAFSVGWFKVTAYEYELHFILYGGRTCGEVQDYVFNNRVIESLCLAHGIQDVHVDNKLGIVCFAYEIGTPGSSPGNVTDSVQLRIPMLKTRCVPLRMLNGKPLLPAESNALSKYVNSTSLVMVPTDSSIGPRLTRLGFNVGWSWFAFILFLVSVFVFFILRKRTEGSPLKVSNEVLGRGSQGTVVLQGYLQGRVVAVKRILEDAISLRKDEKVVDEILLLQSSDHHPNIVRYFYHEFRAPFLYIAFELCPFSLADLYRDADSLCGFLSETKRMSVLMKGVMEALLYLHSVLGIVHRDIKPSNILISPQKDRLVISDFGVGKVSIPGARNGISDNLFSLDCIPTVCGTLGWRAPEILLWESMQTDPTVKIRTDVSMEIFRSGRNTGASGSDVERSCDVFSAGCLLFWTLSGGIHPFSSDGVDVVKIEQNVLKGKLDTSSLLSIMPGLYPYSRLMWNSEHQRLEIGTQPIAETQTFLPLMLRFEQDPSIPEAVDLVKWMIAKETHHRPTMVQVLAHPFFWTTEKRLAFLQDISDRISVVNDDSISPQFLESSDLLLRSLQGTWRKGVPPGPQNWLVLLPEDLRVSFLADKRRKYIGFRVSDLLRAIRNRKNHFYELPAFQQNLFGDMPGGFLRFWTGRFPGLLMACWHAVFLSGILDDPRETVFRSYFVHTVPQSQ